MISLKKQIKTHTERKIGKPLENEGNYIQTISTGSTLLDLAISGTRAKYGGIPSEILVEIFGASGLGKTVLLSEIAGDAQRKGGDTLFQDPEARLNKEFASIFGYRLSEDKYTNPDTVNEMFQCVRKWQPKPEKEDAVNVIVADSLAALSTEMEMENDEGDKMGGKRAKDFSEQARKTCRILKQRHLLMVCSNQIRQNMNTMAFGEKYTTPGGEAVKFYASLRLQVKKPKEHIIYTIVKKGKKEEKRAIGINIEVHVAKSSIDIPFRSANVSIIWNYGIDDIRQNLLYLKEYEGLSSYAIGDIKLSNGIEQAIQKVEEDSLEKKLKKRVTLIWNEFEKKIQDKNKRKTKIR